MVMLILEANVPPEKSATLEDAYLKVLETLDTRVVQTFLTKSRIDRTLYRMLTIWESAEDLDAARWQETPRGVMLFREAGVDPRITTFEVVRQG